MRETWGILCKHGMRSKQSRPRILGYIGLFLILILVHRGFLFKVARSIHQHAAFLSHAISAELVQANCIISNCNILKHIFPKIGCCGGATNDEAIVKFRPKL